MKIYCSRDKQSEAYTLAMINKLVGTDSWVVADIKLHRRDSAVRYYIRFTNVDAAHDSFQVCFIDYDDLNRGVYSLFEPDEINSIMFGIGTHFNYFYLSRDEFECDFSEIYTTQELLDMIDFIRYRTLEI